MLLNFWILSLTCLSVTLIHKPMSRTGFSDYFFSRFIIQKDRKISSTFGSFPKCWSQFGPDQSHARRPALSLTSICMVGIHVHEPCSTLQHQKAKSEAEELGFQPGPEIWGTSTLNGVLIIVPDVSYWIYYVNVQSLAIQYLLAHVSYWEKKLSQVEVWVDFLQ